ncbi:MAG TPA: hypothetical protein VME21_03240, partial [Steroidobacteraceae bacterium]|nr:hypothetical protein [Steroidobacteraceae bacterium]
MVVVEELLSDEEEAAGVFANDGTDTANAEPAIRTAPRTGTSFLSTVDLQVTKRAGWRSLSTLLRTLRKLACAAIKSKLVLRRRSLHESARTAIVDHAIAGKF